MCGSSTPPPPDPYKTAAAQYQFSSQAAKDSAKLAAIDQVGPYGSTTFQRREDGTPISQTVNLSPEVQAWLDSQFGSSTALQDATQRQLGYLPTDRFQLPGDQDATGYAREAFGDAVLDSASYDPTKIATASYEQAKSLFQPDIDASRKQMEIKLAQRGINPGDEIWKDEMDRLDRQANQAYSGASRQATLDAGTEQTRAMNNAVTARNYGSNTYQTDLSNQMLERNQPFSEAAALMGTTPNFQTPSFMNTQGVNIAAPDYQGQVASNYQSQVSASNAQNNALGGILGAVAGPMAKAAAPMMFSDERMKEDREPADGEAILAMFREMPIDDYRYRDEAQEALGLPEHRTGPMAQDWQEKFGGDGQTIDMADMLGKLASAMKALDRRTAGMRAA